MKLKLILGCAGLLLAHSASAVVITFDEFAPDNTSGAMPANRYSALGITFNATDDGSTWGGNANGNPGNWGINGTNGPQFSGFNGASSGLTTTWAAPVSGFSLDVSRSNGSAEGQTFTLQGYLNGVLVDSETITLGPINTWSTVSLQGVINETRWIGQAGFNPYGVDNVVWTAGAPSGVPDGGSTLALLLVSAISTAMVARRRRSS